MKQETTSRETKKSLTFAELRSIHSELLKRRRELNSPELVENIESFLDQVVRSGSEMWNDKERVILQGLLDYWTSFLEREGRHPDDRLLPDFDFETSPIFDDSACPYAGLDPFQASQSSLFFGRDELINRCIDHLKRTNFLAILGASGSGKTSLLRAGIIPELGRCGIPVRGPVIPGSDPLGALAQALEINQPSEIQQFKAGCLHHSNYLIKLLACKKLQAAVLIIDQFEEVFTLCQDRESQRAFLSNLAAVASAGEDCSTQLILSIREDFAQNLAREPSLHARSELDHERLGALTAGALTDVIRRPAERVGLRFEEGVVEDLVSQVLGQPAALPLLQFTLFELWKARQRNLITRSAYLKIGGPSNALARRADEIFEKMLEEERDTTRRIFAKLARFGPTLEVTSRRVAVSELMKIHPGKVPGVLKKYSDDKLLKISKLQSGQETAEVTHEALIRNWPRLVGWLDDERSENRKRLRLTIAADEWLSLNRSSKALLRGTLLQEAQESDDLSPLEAEFLRASRLEERKHRLMQVVAIISVCAAAILAVKLLFSFVEGYRFRRDLIAQSAKITKDDQTDYSSKLILLAAAADQTRSLLWKAIFPSKHEAVVTDLRETLLRSPSRGGAYAAAGANLSGDEIIIVHDGDYRTYTQSLNSGEFTLVGQLPTPTNPFETFTMVGILSKLGPVAYRAGTLIYWTGSERKSQSLKDFLPSAMKTRSRPPIANLGDDSIRMITKTEEAGEIRVRIASISPADVLDSPHTVDPIEISVHSEAYLPVLSDSSDAYAYLDGKEDTRELVVGTFSTPRTEWRTKIGSESSGVSKMESGFVASIGFLAGSELPSGIVRDKPQSALVWSVSTTALDTKPVSITPDLKAYAMPTWQFRPPLAAFRDGQQVKLAWAAPKNGVLVSELKDGRLSGQELLSGLDGASRIFFSKDGHFLTAFSYQFGGRTRVNVWEISSKRMREVSELGVDDLIKQACQSASFAGGSAAFFTYKQRQDWLSGKDVQPCTNRLEHDRLSIEQGTVRSSR